MLVTTSVTASQRAYGLGAARGLGAVVVRLSGRHHLGLDEAGLHFLEDLYRHPALLLLREEVLERAALLER